MSIRVGEIITDEYGHSVRVTAVLGEPVEVLPMTRRIAVDVVPEHDKQLAECGCPLCGQEQCIPNPYFSEWAWTVESNADAQYVDPECGWDGPDLPDDVPQVPEEYMPCPWCMTEEFLNDEQVHEYVLPRAYANGVVKQVAA